MIEQNLSLWSELSRFTFGGDPAANIGKRLLTVGNYQFAYLHDGLAAALVRTDLLPEFENPIAQLIAICSGDDDALSDGLEGRAKVKHCSLGPEQSLTLRRYVRGGWMRRLSEDSFILPPWKSLAQSRPFLELLVLGVLAQAKVSAVLPAAAIVRRAPSGFSYSGLIATETVKESVTLFKLAKEDTTEFIKCAAEAGREAAKMLRAGVFHQDLHPGNVLRSRSGSVVLLDFDKAKFIEPELEYEGRKRALAARWERAVNKYNLPASAAEAFSQGVDSRGDS